MKRLIITLVLGLLILPSISFAQSYYSYTSEQLALRTDLFNFLKEQGYMPEVDYFGIIEFKCEFLSYYIKVSDTDENPMFVEFYRIFRLSDKYEYSEETIAIALNKLNQYKGVKVYCEANNYIIISAELFVRNAEPVKSAFYILKSIIDAAESEFPDECKNVGSVSSSSSSNSISEIPFIITKLEVANADENKNIIQDYGETIWDYKTKFLTPRITVKPFKSTGTYTIFVKLYKDGSLRTGTSSPSGYSYVNTVTISGNSSQVSPSQVGDLRQQGIGVPVSTALKYGMGIIVSVVRHSKLYKQIMSACGCFHMPT